MPECKNCLYFSYTIFFTLQFLIIMCFLLNLLTRLPEDMLVLLLNLNPITKSNSNLNMQFSNFAIDLQLYESKDIL